MLPCAQADAAPKGITFQPDIYPKVLSLLPPPPARILDVGAGEGYFCQLLKERGYQVEACDYLAENFKLAGVPFHKARGPLHGGDHHGATAAHRGEQPAVGELAPPPRPPSDRNFAPHRHSGGRSSPRWGPRRSTSPPTT